ncbi:MFS transporter [Novipirellula artificiosorum]|uniref:Putative nucleoside transporter YegT n=1 Tax=Novipirellula artificiosorum TaxID=2528016 RepID=A0A5C6E5N7_9BACT|nr:MFS transporter [Novipirellula artificiosorum]TWU42439.1 putative nucleoside transporter YegT [Novipirellula artificiosorum]
MNATDRTDPSVMLRLSIMMFFQFFTWGAWYVSATGFMLREDISMDGLVFAVYSVGPLAAIFSPFFLGLIADRYMPTQVTLAILLVIGGLLIAIAPSMAAPFAVRDVSHQHWLLGRFSTLWQSLHQPFVLTLLGHMLCFMPTIALTASLSFKHLKNPEKEFPVVRVLGTIGWICGNVVISMLPGKDESATQFYLAGGCALGLGIYCLTLPHTPPPMKGKRVTFAEIIGLDSLRLFRSPSYTVFIIASFLICIPLAGYFAYARSYVDASGVVFNLPYKIFDYVGNGSATFTMSFGQVSEIFFMLVMPLCFARLGVKWMLAVGMGAWVLRYGLFAMAANHQIGWMIIGGILLHGICYDFFFVTGMIYVNKKTPAAIRSQAQGFLVLVTQGLGMFVGAQVFGGLEVFQTTDGVLDWQGFWMYPAIFAAFVMFGFILLFWDKAPTVDIEVGEGELADAPAS